MQGYLWVLIIKLIQIFQIDIFKNLLDILYEIKSKFAIAHKHLAFLNGVNPQNNERIMSESDYKLMIAYVEHLIQHDSIPKITKKIPRPNLGKTWFR